MKYTLSSANSKGQIVIPKPFREEIGIKEGDPLIIKKVGNAVYIKPIHDIFSATQSNTDTFLDTLSKTRGGWSEADPEELEKQREADKKEESDFIDRSKRW